MYEAWKASGWDVVKKWLVLSIDRWRVQKGLKEVTPGDVVEFMHEQGFLSGEKWEDFVGDIPQGWIEIILKKG